MRRRLASIALVGTLVLTLVGSADACGGRKHRGGCGGRRGGHGRFVTYNGAGFGAAPAAGCGSCGGATYAGGYEGGYGGGYASPQGMPYAAPAPAMMGGMMAPPPPMMGG